MNIAVAIFSPLSVLVGILLTLYIKDGARKVVREEFGLQMAGILAAFKNDLVKTLDKTYKRTSESNLVTEALHDRLDIHEERLNSIDTNFLTIKHKEP